MTPNHPKLRALDAPPRAPRSRPRLPWPLIWGALVVLLAALPTLAWFLVEWYPVLPGVPAP